MSDYPDYVDNDEKPEPTIENVPHDVARAALETATTYRKCPDCGEQQWFVIVPGHNSDTQCRECGKALKIVG